MPRKTTPPLFSARELQLQQFTPLLQ